jgi:glyoxylase-like metal-dependent hydrolase (beta-lactamase superfamily II)
VSTVFTIDLSFQNRTGIIAAYLVPYSGGAVLVDCGPGSTIESLQAALRDHEFEAKDITHVLLTHIHLDHAGAAGFFASQGAQVFVHPVGRPHLIDPEKLIASARRIYAEQMDVLWGRFWSVSESNLIETKDGADISIGELRFTALHTPGHAEHHVSYLLEDVCFTGDVVGIRFPGPSFVYLPIVPPETHFGRWRDSLVRLQQARFKRVAPTHFGLFEPADVHLSLAVQMLDELEAWLERTMSASPPVGVLKAKYAEWLHARGRALGLDEAAIAAYKAASTIQMAADGLFRYWHKVRLAA